MKNLTLILSLFVGLACFAEAPKTMKFEITGINPPDGTNFVKRLNAKKVVEVEIDGNRFRVTIPTTSGSEILEGQMHYSPMPMPGFECKRDYVIVDRPNEKEEFIINYSTISAEDKCAAEASQPDSLFISSFDVGERGKTAGAIMMLDPVK